MKPFNLTGVLILLIFTLCSGKSPESCNRDFSVIRAEKQSLFGGVAGSASVTVYTVTLKSRRSFTFTPDTAWAEGKKDGIYIEIDSFNRAGTLKVRKGQMLRVRFEIRSESTMGGGDYQLHDPGSPAGTPPVKHRSEAMLRYSGGKCKYLFFKDIKMLETIYAP